MFGPAVQRREQRVSGTPLTTMAGLANASDEGDFTRGSSARPGPFTASHGVRVEEVTIHGIDAAHLPESKGAVDRFLIDPHGDHEPPENEKKANQRAPATWPSCGGFPTKVAAHAIAEHPGSAQRGRASTPTPKGSPFQSATVTAEAPVVCARAETRLGARHTAIAAALTILALGPTMKLPNAFCLNIDMTGETEHDQIRSPP